MNDLAYLWLDHPQALAPKYTAHATTRVRSEDAGFWQHYSQWGSAHCACG